MFVGILLIAIGGFFLLRTLDVIPYWYGWNELWPVVIIAVGMAMVADAVFRKSRRSKAD